MNTSHVQACTLPQVDEWMDYTSEPPTLIPAPELGVRVLDVLHDAMCRLLRSHLNEQKGRNIEQVCFSGVLSSDLHEWMDRTWCEMAALNEATVDTPPRSSPWYLVKTGQRSH